MRCKECRQLIPAERLEALPDTLTCVGCSHVKPKTSDEIDVGTGVELAEFVKTNSADSGRIGKR